MNLKIAANHNFARDTTSKKSATFFSLYFHFQHFTVYTQSQLQHFQHFHVSARLISRQT